ncbi:MAG: hypothetical protein V4438_04195 [Patescibacteria group bacterium]
MNELMNGCNWAVNRIKLEQSISALETKKKIDPKIEITEESVKEEYIRRAGKVVEKTPSAIAKSADDADESENDSTPTPRRRAR